MSSHHLTGHQAPQTFRGTLLSITLLALTVVLTAASLAPAVIAGNPTPPEAASPRPQETPEPTPTPSEEESRLLEQKRLLELQRDIEQAKKAIRDAQPQAPTPTSTPLAGDTTLDEGVRMETDIVAYKAMAEAALTLVRDIDLRFTTPAGADIPISNLAIYDGQVVRDWRFYQAIFPAFQGQTEDILTAYKDLLCPAGSGASAHFRQTYCRKKMAGNPLFAANERVTLQALSAGALTSAFSVGGNLIKSFIDLASLFRTDTKITGKSLTMDESALVAEVFRVMMHERPNTILYYPKMFPPRIDPNGQSQTIQLVGLLYIYKSEADSVIKLATEDQETLAGTIKAQVKEKGELVPELAKVKQLKQELNNLYAALRAERVRVFRQKVWEEILEVQKDLSKLKSQAELEARIAYLKNIINPVLAIIEAKNAVIKPLATLNERFQKFVDEFVKVDANGVNALALFIRSEDITAAMPTDDSYWLEIRALAAGGNNRVRKNLIWFFAGARVDHSGGVIIEYTLYNRKGAVVASDKLSHYEGYVRPKKIQDGSFRDPKLN